MRHPSSFVPMRDRSGEMRGHPATDVFARDRCHPAVPCRFAHRRREGLSVSPACGQIGREAALTRIWGNIAVSGAWGECWNFFVAKKD